MTVNSIKRIRLELAHRSLKPHTLCSAVKFSAHFMMTQRGAVKAESPEICIPGQPAEPDSASTDVGIEFAHLPVGHRLQA